MSSGRTGPLPETIGPYIIREKLGAGGMATVYRAYHPAQQVECALKVVSLVQANEAIAQKRFVREVRTLLSLHHPHILPVFDFGRDGDVLYLAMTLLDGQSLDDLLTDRPLPFAQAAQIIRQIASALDYAHARGIIHRDIKPSNILFDAGGKPYLADFGVAYVDDATTRLTVSGGFIGTAAYASPEQCRGEPLDRPSDVYSLGVVVYRMLTGRPLFRANSALALIKMHISAPPPNPIKYNADLPVALYGVLAKSLAKLPDQRYPSALKFSDALNAALRLPITPAVSDEDAWLYDDGEQPADDAQGPAPDPDAAIPMPPPVNPFAAPGAPSEAAAPFPAADHDQPPPPADDDVPAVDDEVDELDALLADEPVPAEDEDPADFDDLDELLAEDPLADPFAAPAAAAAPPPADSAPDALPPIRPLESAPTAPRSSRARRAWAAWDRQTWAVYGTIGVSLVALVVMAAVLIARLRQDAGPTLDATHTSAPLGVAVDYPADWLALDGDTPVRRAPQSATVVLASYPVPAGGPYTGAALVIMVQALDPAALYTVPDICQKEVRYGPLRTLACMRRNDYITPAFERLETDHYTGAWVAGDVTMGPSSWPMVLLPGRDGQWLGVLVAHWDGYDDAEATLRAIARTVRPAG